MNKVNITKVRKWRQIALKITYLMDKLKFHKNICNLNRLISNKCKNFCFRERQDQNTMLYDRNSVMDSGTIPPICIFV